MFMRDGLHLSGKGAAVFGDEFSAAIDSGMGSINNISGVRKTVLKMVINVCV